MKSSPTAVLFYYRLLRNDGTEMTLGGVQTYIINLSSVLNGLGIRPVLVQISEAKRFKTESNGLEVWGEPVGSTGRVTPRIRKLYRFAEEQFQGQEWFPIFCADHFSIPNHNAQSLSIQHGIAWDLPLRGTPGPTGPGWLRHFLMLYRVRRYFTNCQNRVCVDYNFLNWWKATFRDLPPGRSWIIPNFSRRLERFEDRQCTPGSRNIRILFARRFFDYRGVLLMAEATEKVLRQFPSTTIDFFGEGPLEADLRRRLNSYPQVTISRYQSEDALNMCSRYDIAVVPSLGSEGTSLSVVEAMGAGCAVIATYAGGCSNLILSDFNGLLIQPCVDELYSALKRLIENCGVRQTLSFNAWLSAEGFTQERWRKRWSNVFAEILPGC